MIEVAIYPDVDAIVSALLDSVQTSLGDHLVGMYLSGSLATGDFDQDSDVDFVVVTAAALSEDMLMALQAMHARIAATDSHWAIELEGSYIPQHALRRYDPANARHPHVERGPGRTVRVEAHGHDWVIQLHILREQGITLVGPSPRKLIDPVTPDELRQAMRATLREWWEPMLNDPIRLQSRGYQSYAVLTMCRGLYTSEYGAVASKRAAARWAQETLGERWASLIDRAWVGRQNPQLAASPEEVAETMQLIRYAVERSGQLMMSSGKPTFPST